MSAVYLSELESKDTEFGFLEEPDGPHHDSSSRSQTLDQQDLDPKVEAYETFLYSI